MKRDEILRLQQDYARMQKPLEDSLRQVRMLGELPAVAEALASMKSLRQTALIDSALTRAVRDDLNALGSMNTVSESIRRTLATLTTDIASGSSLLAGLGSGHRSLMLDRSMAGIHSAWKEPVGLDSAVRAMTTVVGLGLREHSQQLRLVNQFIADTIAKPVFQDLTFLDRRVEKSVLSLSASYERLFSGIAGLDGQVAAVPGFVTVLPPRDLVFKTTVVASRSKAVNQDELVEVLNAPTYLGAPIDDLLEELDPRFLPVLREAKDAITGNGKGKVRHVAVSLREVCRAVLHHLAPNEEVAKWTTDKDHYHNGRPTRRARMLYINRTVSYGPYARYLNQSVRAMEVLLDTLNDATHNLESDACDFQLRLMLRDATNLLETLIVTARHEP